MHMPLQVLAKRARKNVAVDKLTCSVCVFAFDLLYLKPFWRRAWDGACALLRMLLYLAASLMYDLTTQLDSAVRRILGKQPKTHLPTTPRTATVRSRPLLAQGFVFHMIVMAGAARCDGAPVFHPPRGIHFAFLARARLAPLARRDVGAVRVWRPFLPLRGDGTCHHRTQPHSSQLGPIMASTVATKSTKRPPNSHNAQITPGQRREPSTGEESRIDPTSRMKSGSTIAARSPCRIEHKEYAWVATDGGSASYS